MRDKIFCPFCYEELDVTCTYGRHFISVCPCQAKEKQFHREVLVQAEERLKAKDTELPDNDFITALFKEIADQKDTIAHLMSESHGGSAVHVKLKNELVELEKELMGFKNQNAHLNGILKETREELGEARKFTWVSKVVPSKEIQRLKGMIADSEKQHKEEVGEIKHECLMRLGEQQDTINRLEKELVALKKQEAWLSEELKETSRKLYKAEYLLEKNFEAEESKHTSATSITVINKLEAKYNELERVHIQAKARIEELKGMIENIREDAKFWSTETMVRDNTIHELKTDHAKALTMLGEKLAELNRYYKNRFYDIEKLKKEQENQNEKLLYR